jgi:hypothetical protein
MGAIRLMSYGASLPDTYRRAAIYVGPVLKARMIGSARGFSAALQNPKFVA